MLGKNKFNNLVDLDKTLLIGDIELILKSLFKHQLS